ncbi:MAG: FAD-dependent thymidylate synthase [archaeon]
MRVKLISHTPNPDIVCAAAAYTTIKDKPPSELFKELMKDKKRAEKVLRNVVGYGHHSVIEHAYFTFSIEGISRSCSHQLVRHRMASYSQQSQRYVKFEEMNYVTPKTVKGAVKAKYDKKMGEIADFYREMLDAGIPAEDARFVFPNAAHTNIVVTMNARSLMNFFGIRCCYNAQWEIKGLADKMLVEARKVAPVIFEKAGPRCLHYGYCPEGARTCGRITEVRGEYERGAKGKGK